MDDHDWLEHDLANAEEEEQAPPDDLDELEQPVAAVVAAPVASSTGAESAAQRALELLASKRAAIKDGKRRMVLEEDDQFGTEEHSFGFDSLDAIKDLSAVNLNFVRSGFVEAASISATTFDGHKVTLKRRKRIDTLEETQDEIRENSLALTKLSQSMLEQPYYEMITDLKKAAALAKKQADADANAAFIAPATMVESALWTDRYRPKKFVDLLGDERVHRSALLWLKEWDQCVFKGNSKTSAAAEAKRERRKKRAREGKPEQAEGEEERAPDPFGRPFEKILLLCGPPGLGKTTLAYVLARQAGYQVLEVNASDDRNAKVVTDRIRNALESTALNMNGSLKGSKPTCVVIDEIDGAGGGGETTFVKTLVKLVQEGSSMRKYKGKGKKDRPLMRPIICICNDLYAPTLRPLRPIARIIRFTPPTNVMLVHRLRTICDEEGLGADSKNLTMLTEIAEGDLRSCLNTLQFIKRKSTVVDENAIKSTMVGMKDTGTSVGAVWDRLFKKPSRKKGGGNPEDKYVNRIVRDVQTCGEYEKISQGCFENYLGAKQMLDGWARISEVHDWMYFYDRLDGRIKAEQDYELLGYVPYAFVPWYKLFSSSKNRTIEFPKMDYEAYLRRTAHQEIADAFALGIPHSLKNMFTGKTIASELLPFINRIIAPDLKPVNSQLIKKEERVVLLKLINSLLSMKLAFVQDKNEEGQLLYKIEPPIDVFVHFDGKRASDIAPSRYAVRHLITREMEAEKIKRNDGEGKATTAKDIIAAYQTKGTSVAKPEVREAIDFFGRTITSISLSLDQTPAPLPPRKKLRAVYKFHEGFSNAVKVTQKMSDFL